ncbi:hypothetical protein D3C71_1849620 [compost metagenome]
MHHRAIHARCAHRHGGAGDAAVLEVGLDGRADESGVAEVADHRRLGLHQQRQQIGVDGLGQGIEYVHGWLRKLNEPPIYQRAFQKKNALFEQ